MRNQNLDTYRFEKEQESADPRVLRTRKKVVETVLKQFEEAEGKFDLNISALCDEAKINRTTFYANFKDGDGLATFITHYLTRQIVESIERETDRVKGFENKFSLALERFVELLEEKKELLAKAYSHDSSQTFFGTMNYVVATLIMEIFPLKENDLRSQAKIRMLCGGLNYYFYYEYRKASHSAPEVVKSLSLSLSKPFFDIFQSEEESQENS